MRSYLASLALKCKSFNKETIAGNTFLLLVLIASNRIILRPSSVVGVRVSKLAPFSDLFSLPSPFYASIFPHWDPGPRLRPESPHDTKWGRGIGPDPLLGIRNDLSVR